MAGQIIVPLSGFDQIEDTLPYLERVAQPGVKIVFLIHVSLRRFEKIHRAVVGDPYRFAFQFVDGLKRRGIRQTPYTFGRGADFFALQCTS